MSSPDTVVLVHGLWMTPRSWEEWVPYLEGTVVIDSAPTEGVRVSPPSQIKSLWPFLKNPANRHKPVGFTPEEFHYAFANTLSREDSDRVYERYHIAAPGAWVWADGLIANFKPGHQETWVNYRTIPAPRCCSSPAARTTSCCPR